MGAGRLGQGHRRTQRLFVTDADLFCHDSHCAPEYAHRRRRADQAETMQRSVDSTSRRKRCQWKAGAEETREKNYGAFNFTNAINSERIHCDSGLPGSEWYLGLSRNPRSGSLRRGETKRVRKYVSQIVHFHSFRRAARLKHFPNDFQQHLTFFG